LLRPLRRLEVGLAVDAIVVRRKGRSERLKQLEKEVGFEPGPLGYLLRRVTLLAFLEDPLHRQQDDPVLVDCTLELLERRALLRQVPEQGESGLARLPPEVVEQALGLEVDPSRHKSACSLASLRGTLAYLR